MILVTSPDRPFVMTQKGTPLRSEAIIKYEADINAAYEAFEVRQSSGQDSRVRTNHVVLLTSSPPSPSSRLRQSGQQKRRRSSFAKLFTRSSRPTPALRTMSSSTVATACVPHGFATPSPTPYLKFSRPRSPAKFSMNIRLSPGSRRIFLSLSPVAARSPSRRRRSSTSLLRSTRRLSHHTLVPCHSRRTRRLLSLPGQREASAATCSRDYFLTRVLSVYMRSTARQPDALSRWRPSTPVSSRSVGLTRMPSPKGLLVAESSSSWPTRRRQSSASTTNCTRSCAALPTFCTTVRFATFTL